jgi:hypothetical protein
MSCLSVCVMDGFGVPTQITWKVSLSLIKTDAPQERKALKQRQINNHMYCYRSVKENVAEVVDF